MTPMPAITTPNGCPMTMSPSITPNVESTTAVSTKPTEVSLLNCASRIAKMRKIAVPNALSRNPEALALEFDRHAGTGVGLGERGRDLLLDGGGLPAFGDVGRHCDHAAAVDPIDVADTRRRHALHEIADRHVSRLRLHAQIVDLVE